LHRHNVAGHDNRWIHLAEFHPHQVKQANSRASQIRLDPQSEEMYDDREKDYERKKEDDSTEDE
jgi:hypothetical protein